MNHNTEEFQINRELDAPIELVWMVYSTAEHLEKWWGPAGMKTTVKKFEFKVGGTFHYKMEAPDGNFMWGRFIFQEIKEPNKLSFIVSFSDENGGITRHPLSDSWPLEMFNEMTFTEKNGKTLLSLKATAHNASETEISTFINGFSSMNQGFNGTFDQLKRYLATLA